MISSRKINERRRSFIDDGAKVTGQSKGEGRKLIESVKKASRLLGMGMAVPIFVWFLIGFIPVVPSIIDVFGMDGLRIPTGVVICGLMLAAFGFEDY